MRLYWLSQIFEFCLFATEFSSKIQKSQKIQKAYSAIVGVNSILGLDLHETLKIGFAFIL